MEVTLEGPVLLIEVLEPVLLVAEAVAVGLLGCTVVGLVAPVVVGRVVEVVPVLAAPVVVLVPVPGEVAAGFTGAVVALAVLVPVVLVVPVVVGLTGVAVVLTIGLVVAVTRLVVVFGGDETVFDAGAGRVVVTALAPDLAVPVPTFGVVLLPVPVPVRAPAVTPFGGSGFFASGSLKIFVTALVFSSCDSPGTQLSFSMVSKLESRNFRGFSGALSSVR